MRSHQAGGFPTGCDSRQRVLSRRSRHNCSLSPQTLRSADGRSPADGHEFSASLNQSNRASYHKALFLSSVCVRDKIILSIVCIIISAAQIYPNNLTLDIPFNKIPQALKQCCPLDMNHGYFPEN